MPFNQTHLSLSDIVNPFQNLLNQEITSIAEAENWIIELSNHEALVSEDVAWRYINMTIDTRSEDAADKYRVFIEEIEPKLKPIQNELNKKSVGDTHISKFLADNHPIYFRSLKNEIELFDERNIELSVNETMLAQKYAELVGSLTIEYNNEKIPLAKASKLLELPNRELRKDIYERISDARSAISTEIADIMQQLVEIRNKIAANLNFNSYVDFMFKKLGRFDYNQEDCQKFHQAVKEHIVPLHKIILDKKKQELDLTVLKPYDLKAESVNNKPLEPFFGANELVKKSKVVLSNIHPFFAETVEKMDKIGHFDLESKIGKAPGGYNYPLTVSGLPFIFMNAANSQNDVTTFLHEAGHAVHSHLTSGLKPVFYQHPPSEIAELASMSMELLSMEYWDQFYPDKSQHQLAVKRHIEGIIETLIWVALIDEYQTKLYSLPNFDFESLNQLWLQLYKQYYGDSVDFSGYENNRATMWQKQLHIFEVPFYYIEYGIAQIGAFGVYQNYLNAKQEAIENYIEALKLGYSAPITKVYKTANIELDFSESATQKLSQSVKQLLNI